VLSHPSFSSDLASCDYFLFPKLKFTFKGMRFEDITSIQSAVAEEIRQLSQEVFRNAMAKLERCWTRCVNANGMYFDGRQILK